MLREKTQRRLCRVLFVAGCVAPTLAVAALMADRLSGGERQRVLSAVSQRVGFEVACDAFLTPRPGVYELRGVRLRSGDESDSLADCDLLRVQHSASGWRFAAGSVTARSPALASADWRLLAEAAAGTIERLSLGGSTWERLTASLGPGELRLSMGDRELVALLPERLRIDTADRPAPLRWLPVAPLVGFQSDASFTGVVSVDRLGGRAEGVVSGAGINLSGVAADRGKISELACVWRGDAFTELSGRVELREGSIDPSLVYGMNEWLGMLATPAMQAAYDSAGGGAIPFTQVAFEAELDTAGLTLVGRCDEIDGRVRGGPIAHAVVEHRGEPLLLEPAARPLPTPRLLRALWPNATVGRDIPATKDAIEVARRLPMGDPAFR